MTTYQGADTGFLTGDWKKSVEGATQRQATVEGIAQAFAEKVQQTFSTTVLTRVYVTLPFEKLPAKNKEWVQRLATKTNVLAQLKDKTPVLSLLGTSGKKAAWNDRRNSEGHVGVPLVSAEFVESIPMISRLLKEFGLGTEWLGSAQGGEFIVKSMGRMAVLFYVPDAKSYRDDQGRLVIPAQDFVAEQGVRTVFGAGGAFADGSLCVWLTFTTESIERSVVERFLPVLSYLKTPSIPLLGRGAIFS
jgi:hypothetical protein